MSIGQPIKRLDGVAKVTGVASYAADHSAPDMLYAALVGARIPAGRVLSLDATDALADPAVVRVLTTTDMPRFGLAPSPPLASSFLPMQDDTIRHDGQPIALVLAETLEAAEEAAQRIKVRYERHPFSMPGPQLGGSTEMPSRSPGYLLDTPEFSNGDAEMALAISQHRHDAVYTLSARHANPIETSATLAIWDRDRLTCHDAVQHGGSVQFVLSMALGLPIQNVRVICPHTGGGFGVKGYVWPHQILAAAAARIIRRPVKLVLSRAQMYTNVGYLPVTTQSISLGSDAKGRLSVLRHDVVNATSTGDDYVEFATMAAKGSYAVPVLACSQRIERHDVNLPSAVRAPLEGPGSWAIESAMDELAHRLGLDPLDVRLASYAETDPVHGRPWSSKKLREAYERGAGLFGWRERSRRRDGAWLVGNGMATCSMGTVRFPSQARVSLRADGSATLESAFHDIGTGTLTIFAQIVADVLGIEVTRVETRSGDTVLAPSAPTYASTSTISVGTAVYLAAEDARAHLARLANLPPDDVLMAAGSIGRRAAATGIPIADVMHAVGVTEVVGDGAFTLPGGAAFEVHGGLTPYAMRSFGAVFVEVGVDPDLGLLRLRRAVGSYSAGRIINPRTARAQMTGGVIWGWGQATMEASRHEPSLGRWLSKNLSDVEMPVNADIPTDIQIDFVDEFDPHVGPLGAKGIGELGATGVAAAVANALFDATGVRIRTLPITPAALITALS